MTEKSRRPSKDTRGQEQSSITGKIRLSRQPEGGSFDRESEGQNGVRPKDPARRHSLNVPRENKSESGSHIRHESLKNSHVAIARAEQSHRQADRSLAFIR